MLPEHYFTNLAVFTVFCKVLSKQKVLYVIKVPKFYSNNAMLWHSSMELCSLSSLVYLLLDVSYFFFFFLM